MKTIRIIAAVVLLAIASACTPSANNNLTELEIEKRKRLVAEMQPLVDAANRKQAELDAHDIAILKAHGIDGNPQRRPDGVLTVDGNYIDWSTATPKVVPAPKPVETKNATPTKK